MTFPFWFGGPSDIPPDSGGDVSGAESRARARGTLEDQGGKPGLEAADTALIARIRDGDEDAFALLVRTHATKLTRFAYDYVGSSEIAEDIVDDIFVWIWEHRQSWDVSGSIRSYLFSATRNRALNARRNAKYRAAWIARHAGEPSEAGMSSTPPSVVSVVEARELGVFLREAIDTLSEGRRTAVLLRWMEDMTYAEIAAVMQTSVIGVKQQLNRALRDLREILPEYLK